MVLSYYTDIGAFNNILKNKVLWLQQTEENNDTELNLTSKKFEECLHNLTVVPDDIKQEMIR